jgi:drug/metabolite transporter (DMT)-like permease
METLALKTLSAADTTLIFSTEPLWGAAFASVVMGEHFGPTAIAGGALILAGCLVSNLGIDGIRNMVQPPVNEGNTMGRLTSSGVAGALGAWVSSWSNSGEIVQSGELDEIVEEVISKAHDVL